MALIFTVVVIFFLLSLSEYWWRNARIHNEIARKFVHISVGSFVAFWPYFLSRRAIFLLGLAFIVVVLLSQRFKIFTAIHSVQRPTSGELWFAVTVCTLAILQLPPHIFTAALLNMSLADGFAAVIGVRFGRNNSYTILDNHKSLTGTVTFLLVSLSILTIYDLTSALQSVGLWIVPIAVAATILENLGSLGIDNIVVPLVVGVALKVLA